MIIDNNIEENSVSFILRFAGNAQKIGLSVRARLRVQKAAFCRGEKGQCISLSSLIIHLISTPSAVATSSQH
jgi:hypothetical protein